MNQRIIGGTDTGAAKTHILDDALVPAEAELWPRRKDFSNMISIEPSRFAKLFAGGKLDQ